MSQSTRRLREDDSIALRRNTHAGPTQGDAGKLLQCGVRFALGAMSFRVYFF